MMISLKLASSLTGCWSMNAKLHELPWLIGKRFLLTGHPGQHVAHQQQDHPLSICHLRKPATYTADG